MPQLREEMGAAASGVGPTVAPAAAAPSAVGGGSGGGDDEAGLLDDDDVDGIMAEATGGGGHGGGAATDSVAAGAGGSSTNRPNLGGNAAALHGKPHAHHSVGLCARVLSFALRSKQPAARRRRTRWI